MIIDFHTHTFPEKIAETAVRKLERACNCPAHSDGTGKGLKESMRRAGIDISVALPVVTNPVKAVSVNNLSMQLDGIDGLVYFGGIHPETPDAEAELERIARSGIKGIKIHPLYQGVNIDDPRFVRILSKAGELGLIVVMHAGQDIAYPDEVFCSPQMIRRALAMAGPVKLVCAHMGGWQDWNEVLEYLADTSAIIDTALSLGGLTPFEEGRRPEKMYRFMDEEAFIGMVRAFGSGRVVFGTDSPWDGQKNAVMRIEALALTQEEKRDIFCGSAMRLLGMEESGE